MFKNLQAKFDGIIELPIEIQEICDALTEMGYQDDIRVTSENMDLEQLQGTYTQWTERNGVYGDPIWVSLIVFPSNVDKKIQRLICAKELVHICDANATKADNPQEIAELAEALTQRGQLSDRMQTAGAVVATDMLAQYKALMLLFPKAARIVARKRIEDGVLTVEELEERVQVPKSVLENLLDPEWEELASVLANI